MNTELFIARRLFRDKENKHHLSQKIINIALVGIALGIIVMLVAVAVVTGFKKEVSDKVTGFGSHIQIVNFDANNSFETAPVNVNQPFIPELKSLLNIQSLNVFATKPGIIKTSDYIQGVVFKGVDSTYNWSFFSNYLTTGKIPNLFSAVRSNEVLISKNTAELLFLKVNDPMYMYFVLENEELPRIRQFKVSGIYNTSLLEFDQLFVFGDLRQVQNINKWDSTQVSGFEINLKNFGLLDYTDQQVREKITSYNNQPGYTLRSVSIKRKYAQIFDWLSILDINVWVILVLMVMVAGFNMISALLVLILERSSMVGTLKALGSRNSAIRKIFLYLSGFLLTRGLVWGNFLGISLLLLQKHFQLLKLDPTSYYMEVVPINISLANILLLNLGAITITMVMLLVPSYFVSKISPDKTIRFD